MKSFKAAQSGFTLVELMVVVAIIGILSGIAIPEFRKHQAKAKTVEAKLTLSSIFTAETSFFSDYDTYGTCLEMMGHKPNTSNNYYASGFNAGVDPGIAAIPGCDETATFNWDQNKAVAGGAVTADKLNDAALTAATGAFLAGACGIIDSENNDDSKNCEANDAQADYWSIDQTKRLVHLNVGYK